MDESFLLDETPTGLRLWRAFTLGMGLLSLAAAVWAPGRIEGGLAYRLGLMVAFGLSTALGLAGAAQTWLRPAAAWRVWRWVGGRLRRRRVWNTALLGAAGLLLVSLVMLTSLPDLDEPMVEGIYTRLLPVAAWLVAACMLLLGWLMALRHGREAARLLPHGGVFYAMLVFYAAVWIGWRWVVANVLESESKHVGWNALTAPITEWQALAAWLVGVALLGFYAWRKRSTWRISGRRLDVILALLIWAAAVGLWQTMPLSTNWFVGEPSPPNFEYYPGSDARNYDVSAQTALIGQGYRFFNSVYVRRSLLAAWLTVLHVFGGQSYERVVALQVLGLALIPVLLYFLTRSLLNRPAGVMAAGLLILRQANAIFVSNALTTSSVRQLMADIPAALMALAFTVAAVAWLNRLKGGLHPLLALASGAILGLAMLMRLEMVVLSAPVALAAGLILLPQRRWKRLWQAGALAGLGVCLALAPWVARNVHLTGQWFIDSPYFSTQLLIQRFLLTPTPTASATQESAPPSATPVPLKVKPVLAQVTPAPPATPTPAAPLDSGASNPVGLAGQSLAHILNSQVQAFLYLPSTYRGLDATLEFAARRDPAAYWAACCSVEGLTRRLPFWKQWDGHIPAQTFLPLTINLLLFAYGVSLSWKRRRWAGVTPLLMWWVYITFNGVLQNSGGRYMLPVDWITLLYFSQGLAEATRRGLSGLSGVAIPFDLPGDGCVAAPTRVAAFTRRLKAVPGAALMLASLGVLLLGASVPLLESSFPNRYPAARQEAMRAQALASPQLDPESRQALEAALANGAVAFVGRGLYPRYLPPNVGEEKDPSSPLSPRPYPRMVFYLIGDVNQNVMLPLAKKPKHFPNAADVVVIACPPRDLWATFVFSSTGEVKTVLLREPFPTQITCPLPAEP